MNVNVTDLIAPASGVIDHDESRSPLTPTSPSHYPSYRCIPDTGSDDIATHTVHRPIPVTSPHVTGMSPDVIGPSPASSRRRRRRQVGGTCDAARWTPLMAGHRHRFAGTPRPASPHAEPPSAEPPPPPSRRRRRATRRASSESMATSGRRWRRIQRTELAASALTPCPVALTL